MKLPHLLIALLVLIATSVTSAQSTAPAHAAPPATKPVVDMPVDADLSAVRQLSVQSNQTVKTFDTYARDVLFTITGKGRLGDKPAAWAVLDMAFRPDVYAHKNIIYVRNKPFRQDFDTLSYIDDAEKARIVKEGTLSLDFWLKPETQQAMANIMATATVKAEAINQINNQANLLAQVIGVQDANAIYHVRFLPPVEGQSTNDKPWASTQDLYLDAAAFKAGGATTKPLMLAGYPTALALKVFDGVEAARTAWLAGDASGVSAAFASVGDAAREANPAVYPSAAKRKFEMAYNSLFRLTLPGAMVYFVGFVLFLIAWRSEVPWVYKTAVGVTLLGWIVHAFAIGIRWWLVQKSVGNWFEAIPIKNQFESVLFSAFFGVTVALLLERWKRLGLFGAAAACVGMLSLVAIFSAPYVTGRDIGGEIKQNAGILMTYWLYVHVTLVTASYALIGMTFVFGVWYVVQYLRDGDAQVLKTIDDSNLVMLQLAFWILGIGIITGALWADVSWGRPWGWDPKETFALVTWIVYLIIIHVRFVTAGQTRAITTGVLSIVGFGVMLFNWIGVNFFLVGLHSYA